MRPLCGLQALAVAVSSQLIASPTDCQQRQRNRIQPRQPTTDGPGNDSSEAPSLTKFCETEPACTSQQSILDECAAQYAIFDGRQNYCACTAGFWEASRQCEDCLSEAGLDPDPSYAIGLQSQGSADCASLSLEYAIASSTSTDRDQSYIGTTPGISTSTTSSSDRLRLPTGDWLSSLTGNPTTATLRSRPVAASPTSDANCRLFQVMFGLQKLVFMALFSLAVPFFDN